MQCQIKSCAEEFIDTNDGLTVMMFHVMTHHSADEINGTNPVLDRIEDGGDSY